MAQISSSAPKLTDKRIHRSSPYVAYNVSGERASFNNAATGERSSSCILVWARAMRSRTLSGEPNIRLRPTGVLGSGSKELDRDARRTTCSPSVEVRTGHRSARRASPKLDPGSFSHTQHICPRSCRRVGAPCRPTRRKPRRNCGEFLKNKCAVHNSWCTQERWPAPAIYFSFGYVVTSRAK